MAFIIDVCIYFALTLFVSFVMYVVRFVIYAFRYVGSYLFRCLFLCGCISLFL